MKKIIAFAFCLISTGLCQPALGQSVKEYIDSYVGENAEPYLEPLATMFTSNIHSQVWDWSPFERSVYVKLKIQAMASFPVESMRTFTGVTTGEFMPQQEVEVPTIIGSRSSVIVFGEDNTFYIFPGGLDLERLVLGTPQLTVGGLWHSEASVRFLSFPLADEIGNIRVLGLGGRHALTGHFNQPVVDFSLGYFYHSIQAGTYIKSKQHLFSAHLAKTGKNLFGQLTLGYQVSRFDVNYTYSDEEGDIHVNLLMENNNPWIGEASAGIALGNLVFIGSVNYSKHISVATGIGFIF